jgi:DNA (cytosine-5)-methyltransferase 1
MKPKLLSLYTGAGGLDYGFEAAGFETAAAVEFDSDCCQTLRSNRPKWNVIERSIFSVSTGEMLERAGVRPGEVDLVIGGPPCQPFSKAGYWARGDSRRLDDPRADTLSAYLRVIEEALPQAFLLENVGGLAFVGKDDGLRLLLRGIEELNAQTKSSYKPSVAILNAVDYGVPQLRERLFLIAARDGSAFRFPSETHWAPADVVSLPMDDGNDIEARHRTAWDAIGDVTPDPNEDLEVRGKWAALLPSIPEGSNYLWHTDRGGGRPLFGWRRRYWSFLLKLAKAKPSWTIQAQPGPAIGPFHWENRYLSMRELCRLQTFPDNVHIEGSRLSIQKQVGNAVPSLLAELLGREIRYQLLGHKRISKPLALMPPCREPVPEPARRYPVPKRFRELEGEHAAHPGTGKGYGARKRIEITTA